MLLCDCYGLAMALQLVSWVLLDSYYGITGGCYVVPMVFQVVAMMWLDHSWIATKGFL